MDKLFPILSKERRSKSKENLADDPHTKSETSIWRSKSKDNLSALDEAKNPSTRIKKADKVGKSKEKIVVIDQPKKENKSFLKRNKSKDNLVSLSGEISTPVAESSKGSKSFLKRSKSKDNLDQLAEVHSGTSKKIEDPTKKGTGIVDKARKSTDSSSSSSKSEVKPEFFSKLIKKRDKKLRSHRKTMSVEEETLLKSLDSWYENIDQNIPDEFLSKEDRAVKKLKILFEDDQLKERPVAHKPKEQLAISKPLLNSVVQNPKLDEIVRNPHVPTVETQVRESALEDTFSLVNEGQEDRKNDDGPRFRIGSEEIYTNIGPRSLGIHKTRSLDDLNVFEEYRTESELAPVLYRAVETDNLATEKHLEIKHIPRYDSISSEIYPNDSVSNPRYSTKYRDVQLKEYVRNDLPKPNIYINYENLDEIVNELPKDVPESKLTEEQKFALKLKLALDEAEKKNTLKKIKKKKKSIRGLEISGPTLESVEKNWKLKEIMLNPSIKKAEEIKKDKFFLALFDETDRKRHSTDISSDIGELNEIPRRPGVIKAHSMMSKSYEDISFSFVPENTLLNLHYGDKVQPNKISKIVSDTSSSSQSFTSAEFNLDTGKITQKWDIPAEVVIKQGSSRQQDEINQGREDLLYNETINKEKNKKRKKQKQGIDDLEYKQNLEKLKQDLLPSKTESNLNEENIEDKKDVRIMGSLEKYKKGLRQIVKTIESDELRDSLRRRGFKASEFETQYQIAHAEAVFDEYKISFKSPIEVHGESQGETVEVGKNNALQGAEIQLIENSGRQDETNDVDYVDTEDININVVNIETIKEPVDVTITNDSITDFIFNERKLSDAYNAHDPIKLHFQRRDSQDINEEFVKEDFQISFTGPSYDNNQFQTLHFENNQQYGVDRGIIEDTSESTDFRREQVYVADFINKTRSYQLPLILDDRRSLTVTAEELNHSSEYFFRSDSNDKNKLILDPNNVRIRDLAEVNAHSENSKFEDQASSGMVYQKNVDKDEVYIGNQLIDTETYLDYPRGLQSEASESVEKETDIKSLSKESEVTLTENETGVESIETVIFRRPTEWRNDQLLALEEADDDNYWSVPAEKLDSTHAEAINLIQIDNFKNQTSTIGRQNEDLASQIIIEDITYQVPSTSIDPVEFKKSLEIEDEITEDNFAGFDKDISDNSLIESTVSHLCPAVIVENPPNEGNVYYSTIVDVAVPQTPQITEEYSYKEILKENQYGVVSPLDLRHTYRGVVKEYKKRYPPEQTEETHEVNTEGSDVSDFEYNESFIDEFFEPPKGFEHEFDRTVADIDNVVEEQEVIYPLEIEAQDTDQEHVKLRRVEEAVSQIDEEMQSIMEKYLHTRTSLIVKKTGLDIEDKERSLERKSDLKKYDNFENLHEIDSSGGSRENSDKNKRSEEIQPRIIFENEDLQPVELDYTQNSEDNEPLSLEDLKFIEEMKARYISTDTVPTIVEKSTEMPIITEEEIEYKYQHLTEEELLLIRSAKSERYSRPLSDINERDLLIIDEISRRYFKDGSLPSSVRSSLQEEREILKVEKEENNNIKEDISRIDKVLQDTNQATSIPPLSISLASEISNDFNVNEPYSDSKYVDSKNIDNISFLLNSRRLSVPEKEIKEVEEKANRTDDTDKPNQTSSESIISQSKEKDIAHLPPSLRPRKLKPVVAYQPPGNVIFRDKKKTTSADRLPSLPSSSVDRSSNRLSGLIFKETIFVPVPKGEISNSPKSPLSPDFKSIEENHAGTWKIHEKPDFIQTMVVPTPRKVRPLSAHDPREIKSPPPKSPAALSFRETLFVPSPVERRELAQTSNISISTPAFRTVQDFKNYTRGTLGNVGFKETIIIPAKQRPTSYSPEKLSIPMDPTKSPQSEIRVTAINKPEYHSYKETIVLPKPQESLDAIDQNSELLSVQKSVTQSTNSSRSEVKVNLNRYSAIPRPVASSRTVKTSQRRSLSEPFKPKILDDGLGTYEPVYSDVNFNTKNYKHVFISDIKKPLSVPRSKESSPRVKYNEYLAGTSSELDYGNSKNDIFVNMTDSDENFSELLVNKEAASFPTPNINNFGQIQAKFCQSTLLKECKEKEPVAFEYLTEGNRISQERNVPSDQVILTESKAETDILKSKGELLIESKESAGNSRTSGESYVENVTAASLNTKDMADSSIEDEQSGSSSTVKSSLLIAITTKDEQLDITKVEENPGYVLEEDVEDVPRKPSGLEVSNVNLFNMESHSSYDSYLELFKSKESKDFDNLQGKKSPVKNFFGIAGFAYAEELSGEDLDFNVQNDVPSSDAKPKIVDFVPLDEDTTPFFTKGDKGSYDTLEREKTFHVLGQASKISRKQSKETAGIQKRENVDSVVAPERDNKKDTDKSNLESSFEILAKKSSSFSKGSSRSQTNTSRTSFTQAKKLFEALVEANKDERPKSAMSSRSPLRYNIRDSRSLEHIRIPASSSSSKEGQVTAVGETGLLIKGGSQGPLDPEAPNK